VTVASEADVGDERVGLGHEVLFEQLTWGDTPDGGGQQRRHAHVAVAVDAIESSSWYPSKL
jgi:hypothetical protein